MVLFSKDSKQSGFDSLCFSYYALKVLDQIKLRNLSFFLLIVFIFFLPHSLFLSRMHECAFYETAKMSASFKLLHQQNKTREKINRGKSVNSRINKCSEISMHIKCCNLLKNVKILHQIKSW